MWIPPGGAELTPAEEADFEPFILDVAGKSSGEEILRIFERLYAAHPPQPHYYLSLFGVRADHRGRGIGMRLLGENLTRIDAEGMPCYLESSNPANLQRYARSRIRGSGRGDGAVRLRGDDHVATRAVTRVVLRTAQ